MTSSHGIQSPQIEMLKQLDDIQLVKLLDKLSLKRIADAISGTYNYDNESALRNAFHEILVRQTANNWQPHKPRVRMS